MTREEILLKCLELEWQDHFQTRKQTWKTLEIVGMLAILLVILTIQFENRLMTSIFSSLQIIAAFLGILITFRHRKVEALKLSHITNIEKELELINIFNNIKPPSPIRWYNIFSFKSNTPLFIIRMHVILLLLGVTLFIFG